MQAADYLGDEQLLDVICTKLAEGLFKRLHDSFCTTVCFVRHAFSVPARVLLVWHFTVEVPKALMRISIVRCVFVTTRTGHHASGGTAILLQQHS